jgi:hypothetical protein
MPVPLLLVCSSAYALPARQRATWRGWRGVQHNNSACSFTGCGSISPTNMISDCFSNEFLMSLPSDTADALDLLNTEFSRLRGFHLSHIKTVRTGTLDELKYYVDFIDALAIIRIFCKSRNLEENLETTLPNVEADKRVNIQNISNGINSFLSYWIQQLKRRDARLLLKDKEEYYSALFNSEKTYDFSDSEMEHIQKLINELRKLISTSNLINDDYKRRLLRRLEDMQRELHKHTRDIYYFWGFVAEAGIVARKFGEDLQPISDRVQELGKIVFAVIMAKEGVKALPDIANLLNPK